ncbi:hypothetical protein ACFC1T_09565 [Kitasatospora sp. NPDC056076]|uniref:hypothetical protein n=1 Tax=Kitasatospora sp. NPDC056076 TaxID=3345703 RepID=UPI0035E2F4F9
MTITIDTPLDSPAADGTDPDAPALDTGASAELELATNIVADNEVIDAPPRPDRAPAAEDVPGPDADQDDEIAEAELDEELPLSGHWSGVLAPLGEFASSRDRRLLKPPADGMLRVRPLPLPLYVQYTMESGHQGAKLGIGKINRVWIEGNNLMGEGEFDLADPEGATVARKVSGGYLRFVSVDLDDDTQELGCLAEDNTLRDCAELGVDAEGREGIVFADWRLMGATIVGHPAYQNAFITMVEAPEGATGALVASSGNTGLPMAPRNTPWDGAAARAALLKYATGANGVNWDKYGEGFAYQAPAGPKGPKEGDFSLPFATLINGRLMAVWKGVAAAAAALQGSRGGVDLPKDALSGVRSTISALYAKARDAFKDPGIQVPWAPVTKASATFTVTEMAAGQFAPSNWRPRGAWFEQPLLDSPTSFMVTPAGRIVGHLAAWGICHVGFDNQCVMAPRSTTDYQYYRSRPLQTDEGVVHVGLVTMDTGHAALHHGSNSAAAHYDNTGTMAAVVTCGEDQHGIWVAGQVLPHLTPDERLRLSLSGLSGDWRAIRGEMELIAALAVVSEGFPKGRTFAKSGASGSPYALLSAGSLPPAGPPAVEPSFATVTPGRIDPITAQQRLAQLNDRMTKAMISAPSTTAFNVALVRPAEPVAQAASAPVGVAGDAPSDSSDAEGDDTGPLDLDWDNLQDPDGDGDSWGDELAEAVIAWLASPDGAPYLEQIEQVIEYLEGEPDEEDQDEDDTGMRAVLSQDWAQFRRNWVQNTGTGHLPQYIKRVEKHLRAKGMTESHAIAVAVNVVKRMCSGAGHNSSPGDRLNFPGIQTKVNAKSIAEACAAVTEWEAKRAQSHAQTAGKRARKGR